MAPHITVSKAVLQPVVTLVAWSMIMWAWMYVTRIPAIFKAKMQLDPLAPRGEQMATLPATVRWKADNYNHLMEQPTLFYAIGIALSLTSTSPDTDALLAWIYVVMRVIHSFVQATWNKIEVRFALFFLSSLVLVALTVRAMLAVF